jgi:hypothetical protein
MLTASVYDMQLNEFPMIRALRDSEEGQNVMDIYYKGATCGAWIMKNRDMGMDKCEAVS